MLATLEKDALPASDTPALKPLRKGTLLIVDDEDGPRQSLRVIFKDEYDLLLAGDGATAIDLARRQKHSVDVAILDIRMTGMSGIDVLAELKEIDPHLEVVMITAFETPETMKQALRLCASDYINKPFDISTIRAAVAKAMERRILNGEIRKNIALLSKLQTELQAQKIEEEVVRDRGEIYASVLHDINGPLTVISCQIQMINQRVSEETQIAGDDLDSIKDRLRRTTRQVNTCIEISRRYLDFLRKGNCAAPQVWVNQILSDLDALLRVHPKAKPNQLFIHPLPEDVCALVNGIDLIQVLLNLTLNALQCTTSPHRVEIRGQMLSHPLDLSLFSEGPEDRFINREGFKNTLPLLSISVQDSGPGIKPEVMSQIFSSCFTTLPKQSDTGLGLCIVQRLLRAAQGALHVHSKPGQGTVCTIYVPARDNNAAPTLCL